MSSEPRPVVRRESSGYGTVCLFLLLGAGLLAYYVHVTPFNLRTHDIGSHLAHVDRAAKSGGITRGTDCWECRQPFAYYAIAAGLISSAHVELPKENASAAEAGAGARWLQGLAASLAFGTLACWLFTIRLALTRAYDRVIASAIATFWPTLPIEGAKVGNDALVYLLVSACVWQLVVWRRTGRAAALVLAGALAGAAVNAKANGFVAVGVVLAALVLATVKPVREGRRWAPGATLALVAMGAMLGLWLFVLAHYKAWSTHPDFRSIGDKHLVANTLENFVWLDPSTFRSAPWVVWDASRARDEFWNYLLRSSLFGEYNTPDRTTMSAAYVLVFLAAAFSPFLVAGLAGCVVGGWRRPAAGHLELALTLLGFLGFSIVLRLEYPYDVHNDFRFILPVVLPGAVMTALSFGWLRQRLARSWPHLAALPGWLVVGFCVASVHVSLFWVYP